MYVKFYEENSLKKMVCPTRRMSITIARDIQFFAGGQPVQAANPGTSNHTAAATDTFGYSRRPSHTAGVPNADFASGMSRTTAEFTPTVDHAPIFEDGTAIELDAKNTPSASSTCPVMSQCDDSVDHAPTTESCPTDTPTLSVQNSPSRQSHVRTQLGQITVPSPISTFRPT